MRFSVVVPLLNEKAQLVALLTHLRELESHGNCEIIVVDGGSTDGSVEMLQQSGLRLVYSARGRAVQMNAGAVMARGDWLLFLHADTRLANDALVSLEKNTERESVQWGRFDISIEGASWWFPLIAGMINLRSRLSGIATGDQAIFVRRSLFEASGGFPPQPLMEDIELSRRLLRKSRPYCLCQKAKTSGRRWQKFGVLRTVLLMWRLRFDYWRGVSAESLAKRYQ
ncbi:TIGR04283 family arsenosugar biosynthesis glycosyltransferase [Microbulbifer sp. OS29]|uniref:TIGR04283 family arsenosugar biosynthesis glycosyltransferase n=1 Tax=Microbulbifer okhotskensis TaxID=2926617 RepID=A0A9X2ELC5_9GAMM|nr:TIGR04283 family arsenosugar biosynthesis glycosyltransferase [Microbulbifer okhotskensis]MCO1334372.1 TIGR04283 family arsenosugar biosynthesis glycosyltransferase [Microbulbifer okhotskensis]